MANDIATEVRLFKFGENPTEKGTFLLTKADAAACVAAWKARGTDLSWDYEHAVTEIQAHGAPAAAWCGLEVRNDGLWAVNIRWTSKARAHLEAKEYRYFSPFFEHDEKGHVLNVINVALTNIPATHGISPLVAASALARRKGKRGPYQQIPGGRGVGLKRSKASMAMSEEMKALAEKICSAVMAAFDDGSGDKKEEDETTAAAGDPPPPSDDDSKAAAAALCALTGETSPLVALAKLTASGGQQTERVTHEHKIELAIRDGKLAPALKSAALTWTGEQLAAYLGAAPQVRTVAGGGAKPPANGAGGAVTLSASDHEVCKRTGISPEKLLEAKVKLNGVIPQGARKGG